MAYDEDFAARVRDELHTQVSDTDITERKMFGGLAFMIGGQMTIGVNANGLMARIRADDEVLAEPGVQPFEMMVGKPSRDFIVVAAAVLDDDSLARWIARARAYAATLPPKKKR